MARNLHGPAGPELMQAARELLPAHRITEIARKLGVSRSTLYAHMGTILDADGPEELTSIGSTVRSVRPAWAAAA